MSNGITVDFSEIQVDLIVKAVKARIKDAKLFTPNAKEYIKELENIVWALGKGDEL